MLILVAVRLTDEQVAKIGWQAGLYRENLPDKDDVKDYLDATLSDTINNLPSPPQVT